MANAILESVAKEMGMHNHIRELLEKISLRMRNDIMNKVQGINGEIKMTNTQMDLR